MRQRYEIGQGGPKCRDQHLAGLGQLEPSAVDLGFFDDVGAENGFHAGDLRAQGRVRNAQNFGCQMEAAIAAGQDFKTEYRAQREAPDREFIVA